jgi:hypothetical protein
MDESGGLRVFPATAFPISCSNKGICKRLPLDLILQDLAQALRAEITLEEFLGT